VREPTANRAEDVAIENVTESSGDRFLDEKIAQREHRPRRQATNLSSDLLKESTAVTGCKPDRWGTR